MVMLNCEDELQDNDVVISGFGGRFPMSDNIDEFRDNLLNKVDMVQPVEEPAWKNAKFEVPKYAGLMDKKDKFDAGYFGINQKYSNSLDIMTRLTMEKANEAIFDAGLNPQMLHKSNTTVIIGAGISESETTWLYSDVHTGLEFLGHSRALLANRISFWLNINASSYALSSMETSGIEGISFAYNGIKKGHFDAALVGTIGLVFLPHVSYLYNKMGLLSQDGKTRSFDEAADGYARSDAVSVIFMQKAKDAKRIYAKVTHVAAGYRQKSVDILRPMADAMVTFLEEFYQECGIDPTKISFLEADGSATKLGDREELNGLDKVFNRTRTTPLLIGSVKSNMGHASAASNFTAVAKVLIAMQTGNIPPNLHYKNPASAVPALKENRFKVVTETTPWEGGMVAVNSVSMSGVYGHLLLQTCGPKSCQHKHSDGIPRLVTFSARTQQGLEQSLQKLESMPMDVELISLLHSIHSLPVRNHLYRGYTILPADDKVFREIQYYNASSRPVWFVFSGMGSQWPGMGKEIMKLPVCAARIEKCHQILSKFGVDLKHIITTEDPAIFDSILYSFVGIAAIQLALVDALRMLNILPDGIIGHSVGELGCAYADGCFTAEQMILAAYYRGLASVQTKLIKGSMAAVGLSYEQVKELLPPEVDVACHNSNTSCTLSGPVEPITKFVAELKEKGIFAKAVNVANIAYHSRYIRPAAPVLLEALKKIIAEPKARSKLWVCTSLPEKDWNTPLAKYSSAEYHTNNLLSPVLFEEGSKHIPKNAVVIEIAPHGLLQAILRRSLDPSCTNIPLTQRGHPQGLQFLLAAFGKIYMAGPVPKVQDIYPPVEFPVSRGTPSVSPIVTWDYSENWHVLNDVLVEKDTGEREVTISLNQAETRVYADHIIEGKIIMPSFAYLKLVWQTFAILKNKEHTEVPIVFENVEFHQQLEIPNRGSLKLYVMVQRGSGDFEISENKKLIVSGRIREAETENENQMFDVAVSAAGTELTSDDVYAEFKLRGCNFGEPFRGIQQVKLGDRGLSGKIMWSDNWVTFGEALLQLICLQVAEHSQNIIMPAAIRKITINPLKHKSKREVMEAMYCREVNMARCGCLELQHIEMTSLDHALVQQPGMKMETLKFLSHCNPPVQGIKNFVEMCIQLVLENCRHTVSNLSIIELTTGHPLASLTPHIKALLPHYTDKLTKLKVTLKSVIAADSLHQITKEEKANCSLVVVTSSSVFNEAVSLLRNERGFILMRMDIHEKCCIDPDFITVAEQRCGTKKIVLLRKVYETNEDKSMVVYPKGDCSTWLDQVKQCKVAERLYVAAQINPIGVGKLPSFVGQITADRQLSHVRCVFISDRNVAQFTINEETFKQIVKQDLVVNVLRSGTWGSFRCMLIGNNFESAATRILPSLKDITTQYLGIDVHDTSSKEGRVQHKLQQQESVEFVDFSGVTNDGGKVMGIARACDTVEYLSWPVPEKWTLEDAATVPLAYTTAYYALTQLANLEQHDTVLIHCGWTNVGQASISIALHYNCTVFTSVTTPEQKQLIKQRFPQIKEEHILNTQSDSFEISLLRATKGKGVRVILNMLSVSAIDNTMNCLAKHSCVVHLGRDDLTRHTSMGMRVFLKNVSFWAVSNDFLMTLTPESKEALHASVQEGIVSGVVQPLVCQAFPKQIVTEPNHMGRVIVNVTEENKDTAVKNHKFRCDPCGSYLVAGGHAEQCMDVAEWLVMHGARQVVIALRSKMVSNLVRRRINLLEVYQQAHIALVSTPAATTASNAINLLQEAKSASGEKLMGIFILPAETSGQENGLTALTVSQLDAASRGIKGLQYFVCLLSEGSWSTCEARHQEGLMALAVYWPEAHVEGFSLRQSLNCLDKLLAQENHEPVVIITYSKLAASSKGYQLSSLKVYLPCSLELLQSFGKDVSNTYVCMERLQSQIPDTVITEDTPKVFLIPGLQGAPRDVLHSLAMRIIYPVFCLKMGIQDSSLLAVAQQMVECIQRVQRSGCYYLVGVSWGGGLTLQIAKLLEAQGNKTRIVLVDGALETSHLILASLDTSNSARMQANLLCQLLHINHHKVHPELTSLPSWDARVQRAVSEVPAEVLRNKDAIVRALNIILCRISALLSYQPKDILLSSAITLVRPVSGDKDENCGLMQYFKQTVITQVVEGDHRTILDNPLTARTINSFAI